MEERVRITGYAMHFCRRACISIVAHGIHEQKKQQIFHIYETLIPLRRIRRNLPILLISWLIYWIDDKNSQRGGFETTSHIQIVFSIARCNWINFFLLFFWRQLLIRSILIIFLNTKYYYLWTMINETSTNALPQGNRIRTF